MVAIAALGAVLAGCAPRGGRRVAIAAGTPVPRSALEVRSDGKLVTADGQTIYDDAPRGISLTIPVGWVAATTFPADDSGPPPLGELRLRARLAPEPTCVIDLAIEPPTTDTAAVRTGIPRGRELFFFSEIDEPLPTLPMKGMGTSTAVPAVAGVADLAYGIATPTQLIRIEGRFPTDRFPECKASLDAMVKSLSPHVPLGRGPRAVRPASP